MDWNLSIVEDSLIPVWLTKVTFIMWNMSFALQKRKQLGRKNKRSTLHMNKFFTMTRNYFIILSVCDKTLPKEDDWVVPFPFNGQDMMNDTSKNVSVLF